MRDKLFKKGLVVGIICLLILVTIPTSVSDNITESIDNEIIDENNEEFEPKVYGWCQVDITGIGFYTWDPLFAYVWTLEEGTVSIEAFFSIAEGSEIRFFDNFMTLGLYNFCDIIANMKYTVPRGTFDILPDQAAIWQFIEATAREVFERYNYKEIRTPIFESTELFARGGRVSHRSVERDAS